MRTRFNLNINHLLKAITLLVFMLLIGSAHSSMPALAQAPQTTAFVNVNVIPMDTEQVLENQTVIVEGERITIIGSADEVEVPGGAEVIDGNGAYLMPGLADMHIHFDFDYDPGTLRLYLANGVTTIRNLNSIPQDLVWREQVAKGELLGPTIYTSGETIVGFPAEYAWVPILSRTVVIVGPIILGLLIWLIIWLLAKFTPIITNFGPIRRFMLPSLAVLLLVGGLLAWFIPLTTYARMRGAQVLWGRCYEEEGAPPYWPWVQIIRSYVYEREPSELMSEMGPGAAWAKRWVSRSMPYRSVDPGSTAPSKRPSV